MPVRIIAEEDHQTKVEVANLFGLPNADVTIEQKPEGLSFCLIMKNEERFLEGCLASVASVADELCVVDTGSTDRSIEIAKSFGARIEVIEWPMDFAKARNVSLDMARYRWTLTLDADEELTPQSLFALHQIKHAPVALTAVMCRIQNITIENDGGNSTFSHYLPRLFPNTPRLRYRGAVHERLVVDQENGALMVDSPITLLHYGYQDDVLVDRDKTNRNSPLILKEAEENPDDTFCVFNLAMLQMSQGQNDESIKNFERMFVLADEKNENKKRAYFAPAYITLAMEYYRTKGEYDRAMELLDTCLEINEYYPNALYFKANLYAIKGKHAEARESLKKAVDAQEFIKAYAFVDEEICLWKAKYYLALSYAGTKDYEDALHWIERAVEARSAFIDIRMARARILETMGKNIEAEAEFFAIARLFDSDAAILEYVSCLMRMQRYTKVLEVVAKESLDRSLGTRMQLYIAAAKAAKQLSRPDAMDYVAKVMAIERHPHAGVVIQALEELYLEMNMNGERDELRAWELAREPACVQPHDFARRSARWIEENAFNKALEVAKIGLLGAPEHPHLTMNAAIAESRLGQDESAIVRLAKLDPYIDLETYLVGSYLRALLLQRSGEIESSLHSLEGLLQWKPDQIDALLMRARLQVSLHLYAQAEQDFLAARQHDYVRASIELAGLYLRTGRYDEAQTIAEEAIGRTEVVA